MTDKQDLRAHPRFPVDEVGVKLQKPGLLSSLGMGNKAKSAVNLSEGGVLVVADQALEEGTRVQIKLDVDKFDDHIASQGEVRWCAQSARGQGDYFVGIRFTTLADGDRKKISRMRTWFTSPEYKVRATTRRRHREASGS